MVRRANAGEKLLNEEDPRVLSYQIVRSLKTDLHSRVTIAP